MMALFDSLSPKELVILESLVALTLTEGKSSTDNNVLGNFLTAVSGIILSIAAQQQNLESLKEKEKQIQDLQKQIKKLKNDL
ncbi:hypothetical protein Clopa_0536 [Clostridium pasteurianum BC1]|uniref:Uncharacterized protein n=2 Tax=Clostridium pasteurianum TaxID=1501 RepID=R4K1F7_CLOPA|nr:hypothetical protein [Clostridium pasteurianum]AGK95586.1 hypothetical protein Clopa_0536 [Clostridium pasteurianum BC1]